MNVVQTLTNAAMIFQEKSKNLIRLISLVKAHVKAQIQLIIFVKRKAHSTIEQQIH